MAKKATRAAYGEALVELAERYPELVVLDADLSSATMTKAFGAKYPERFFNCGIAEANMTGIAAGMSTCGLKPFTNTFAIFAAGRAYEQVRNSIAYPQLNVTVVGSHGGVSVGEDGATHQAIEDLTLMRVIPGMTVVNPCDAYEMRQAVEALIRYQGPAYLRLGRAPVETVTDRVSGYRFELGKGVTMREGTDVTFVATGLAVQLALDAAELLEREGVSARVLNIHTIKPMDRELILKAARETGLLITVEEHSVKGGLGGEVAEFLAEEHPTRVIRHGIYDSFGRSGTAADVLSHYGLTAAALAEKALTALGREIHRPEPEQKYYLAIDIGAASGRHIVGWQTDSGVQTREVYRFPTNVVRRNGNLIWDVEELVDHVKEGIRAALDIFPQIRSFSIDTWGVDYVLFRGDKEVWPCYSYRDTRTNAVIPEVHAKIPFSELYRRTGIQYQTFNTVYQLCADQKSGRLEGVTDMLMLPEYLSWRLTGVKVREAINAATMGVLDVNTGEYDWEIIDRLGLPHELFAPLSQPGTEAGSYCGMKCILCASHDTASSVEGIPMEENAPYISSGTWSLLGLKTKKPIISLSSELSNWSNEPGIGFNRYQKNIVGMWLVNRLKDVLCPEAEYDDIVRAAEESTCDLTIDVNEQRFFAPENMRDAFDEATGGQLSSVGDYFRCAYRSLARSYMTAIQELQFNTGEQFDRIYIVGGGAWNRYLNRLTEEATGKQIVALQIEATALGNLKVQMQADQ